MTRPSRSLRTPLAVLAACVSVAVVVAVVAAAPRTEVVSGQPLADRPSNTGPAGTGPASTGPSSRGPSGSTPTSAAPSGTGRSPKGTSTPSTGGPPTFPDVLDAATLRRSLVHMDVDYQSLATNYVNQCTGTKVSIDARVFVMSAAHCLHITKDDYLGGHPARVATTRTPYSFAVDVSEADGAVDSPFFAATRVVESQTADVALFRIDPMPIHAGPSRTRRFADVPALPIQQYLFRSRTPGQASTSSSFPADTRTRVDSPGRYLGRVRGVNGPHLSALDDIVGLIDRGREDLQANDACLFGGSGSLAVTSGGLLTGPLSGRVRTRAYADGSRVASDFTPAQARVAVGFIDRALHTRIAAYPTLCLYTVLDDRILRQMLALFPSR